MFSLRKNKHKRFNSLIRPHTGFLYNMALKYCGNTYDAEDIVQETLFIALKKIDQLREDSKSKSWAYTIMRNVFLKEVRSSGKKTVYEFDDKRDYLTVLEEASGRSDIHDTLEQKINEEQIQKLIGKLTEKHRSPILLYFMEDLSYQEISEYLDIPMGTVMSRLSRGKAILKKEMIKLANNNSDYENVVEMSEFKNKQPSER